MEIVLLMANLFSYFINAGPNTPGRKAKGSDPRAELRKAVSPKILSIGGGLSGRNQYNAASFNWEQIDKAIETDSYISQALLRYFELMWKEGYKLKSADTKALTYIKHRIKILGLAQGQSFDKLLREIGENLVKYHNCFIYKARSAEIGRISGLSLKGLDNRDPIGGYFVIPTKTVKISEDAYGNVIGYRQEATGSGGKPIDFKPEDIIHLRHMRKSGTQWGIPFLDAAIEDIRSFRLIEEDMLNIVHSEIYPTIHYSVNGKRPEIPTTPEDIERAAAEISLMKDSGFIITDGGDEIESINVGGESLDVEPYIAHFKERAIIGLGISPDQLGIGSDTDKINITTYDKIKTYQDLLADVINNHIFFELLIEGGFDPLTAQRTGKTNPEVIFEFKEIDVDAQIKRDNHAGVKWLQNEITHDELREELGYPVDPNYVGVYHIDAVSIPLSSVGKSDEGGENANSPAKGTSGSTNNPANQTGNRGGPKVKA